MDIRAYLSEEKEAVEGHLADIIARWPAAGSAGYRLAEAMAYSLNAGEKGCGRFLRSLPTGHAGERARRFTPELAPWR